MTIMKSIALLCIAPAALLVAACATTAALSPTSVNPASEGQIIAREGPNGNTRLDVRLDHLPDPAALGPSLAAFVVWVKPTNGDYVNVGQITIDDDREGRLLTTTPHRQFSVVVTAEPRATTTTPSGPVMMRGEVDRKDGPLRGLGG